MTLFTRSKWVFGHNVTQDNQNITIVEGLDTFVIAIDVGSYTFTEFASQIQFQMNEVLTETYTVTTNRDAQTLTIDSTGTFDLLIFSGNASSLFPLMGFTGADLTGVSSATSDSMSGENYTPQIPLQDFINFDNDQAASLSSVNTSASGRVQAVRFGINKFMTCNIRWVHDTDSVKTFLEADPNAESNLRNFLEYATLKRRLEFVPNVGDNSTFTPCILESTRSSRDGTGFQIREIQNLAGWYESGRLRFRELN